MVRAMVVTALALTLLGFPMWLILGITSLISIVFFIGAPLSIVPQVMFGALNHFVMLAVPLFILAGHIMARGSMAERLVMWMKSLVGNLPGGLPITALGVNEVFGAISGSAPATTATLGKILYPGLRQNGYGERFSAGLLTSSGALSSIVPPSVNMILLAAAGNLSVSRVFLGGVGPSVLIVLLVGTYCAWYSVRRFGKVPITGSSPASGFSSEGELGAAAAVRPREISIVAAVHRYLSTFATTTVKAFWALGAPLVIFGGIYSGVATPTEVAAISCLYALLVSGLIYRELTAGIVLEALRRAAMVTSKIFIIMATAGLFSWVLTVGRIPQNLVQVIEGSSLPWWGILAVINLLLLGVGMFMDPVSAVLILTPILMPLAPALDLEPVHFGVIMIVNLAIGMFTPPFGLNLFVATGIFDVPISRIVRGLLPFIAIYLFALAVISYVPVLSLWLTRFAATG